MMQQMRNTKTKEIILTNQESKQHNVILKKKVASCSNPLTDLSEFEMQRNKELEEQIQIIKEEHKQNLKNLIGKNREEILNLRVRNLRDPHSIVSQRFYQEKCEKVQFKYNQLTENARQYGSLFLDRMEKQEADAEREIDDKV